MPQPLRSTDPELRELRHRYNRLYARFTEVADSDPALAARAVQELQDLSDRIVALEGPTAPMPSEPPVAETDWLAELPAYDASVTAEPAPRLPEPGESSAHIVTLRAPQATSDGRAGEIRGDLASIELGPRDLDKLHAAIERQEVRIAALLRKCDEHRQQLAAMEQRIIERHSVTSLVPQIESLGRALDQQQQRITGLAIVLQRLLQWLAAERQRPKS